MSNAIFLTNLSITREEKTIIKEDDDSSQALLHAPPEGNTKGRHPQCNTHGTATGLFQSLYKKAISMCPLERGLTAKCALLPPVPLEHSHWLRSR